MHARRDGWVIHAPLGRTASYVSQSFPASKGITVAFCLTASPGAATRLVRLAPGGISLDLVRGHLELKASHPGRLQAVTHTLTVVGRPTAVELVVDRAGTRVEVHVGGSRQGSFVGKGVATRLVQIGSLVPSRRSSVTLSGLRVTTSTGRVIPAPTRVPRPGAQPTPAGSPQGSSAGGAGTGSAGLPVTAPEAGAQGGSASAIPPAPWPVNPFSPTSVWNAPLAPATALDSNSQAYAGELLRQVKAYGPWMNTTEFSTPVYEVSADQPAQHVTLDTWAPDLQAAFDAVPIPAGAQSAAGTDAHMVVWQPTTDKMWEFWQMQKKADGWHATWGGEIDNVSTSPGYFTHMGGTAGLSSSWGATATGLPLLGGLVTEADLKRGYINHALAISLVEAAPAYWSWPAQRTDGSYWSSNITPILEGTRFRLDPTLDIASLHLPTIDRMLAQAAQTYGIVVRDKAGSVAFYGEDPKSLTSNPWPAAFGNQYPNLVLQQFPWSHLQALQTEQSCCWAR